jgi:uncharacterized RDD family membrane protein YckC
MEENTQAEPQQPENLFDDHVRYVEASRGSRFFNFLIDNLFMNYALSYATGYLAGTILSKVAPEFLISVAYDETSTEYYLFIFIVSYFNYLFYYTICEKAFNGYTLGKAITGTKAIRIDGGSLTFRDAFLRSLSRIVPFEALSGFGKPWHDSWTKTTVIKAR